MYRETLKAKDLTAKSKLSADQVQSKVNRICEAFLSVLEKAPYKESHLQNIITSHVCKVPADLEAGLNMIGRLQGLYLIPRLCFVINRWQLRKTRSLIEPLNIFVFSQTSINSTTLPLGFTILSLHC